LIEEHSVPSQAGAGLQDIELARISQEVTERFYPVGGWRFDNAGGGPIGWDRRVVSAIQRIAVGATVEPVAPCSFSGCMTNANS
jgi:hypothetical protein